MKMLILDGGPAGSLAKPLVANGFIVERAADSRTVGEQCVLYYYDVVVLGIEIPMDGLVALLEEIKGRHAGTGIIIVSGPVPVQFKVEMLLAGADDYLVCPVDPGELSARIKTLVRRCAMRGASELSFNEVKLNPLSRDVRCCGQAVNLTRKEYELLFYFLRNTDRVLTHEMIAEYLWGDWKSLTADCFDFIYSHIKNIRKKLSRAGASPFINTVYGVGYIVR